MVGFLVCMGGFKLQSVIMTNALWTVNLCCVMLFEIVNMSLQEGKLTSSLKTVISLEGFFFLIAQKTTVLVLSHSILCYNKQC